jgi:hypothetical protein
MPARPGIRPTHSDTTAAVGLGHWSAATSQDDTRRDI